MNTLQSYLQDDENKEQIKNNHPSLPRQNPHGYWKDYGENFLSELILTELSPTELPALFEESVMGTTKGMQAVS